MRRVGTFAAILNVALAFNVHAHAQAQTPKTAAQPLLDFVEVVGCLSNDSNNTWLLTNATVPVVQRTQRSNPEALKEAAAKPLGTQRFRLLNVTAFGPDSHKGHKIVVRGVWLKDPPKDQRLNLTSLQTLDATCAK